MILRNTKPPQNALYIGIIIKKKALNGKVEKYVPSITNYGKDYVNNH